MSSLPLVYVLLLLLQDIDIIRLASRATFPRGEGIYPPHWGGGTGVAGG